jgi:hypothetical protein
MRSWLLTSGSDTWGVLGGDLKTIASKTREDVKFESGKEYVDDLLVNLAAPVVLGTLSRFADKCGKLICAGVRSDRVTLMFFKLGELHVVVLAEPGPPLYYNAEARREIPSPVAVRQRYGHI